MSFPESFVAAFNARDLQALAARLAPEATARVVGAPFPEEVGRDAIRETSLAYLLGDGSRLRAEGIQHRTADILLFDDRGPRGGGNPHG